MLSAFLGILADRFYESYVSQTPFVGWPRLWPVLWWSAAFLSAYFLIAFVYQAIMLAAEVMRQHQSDPTKLPDPRRKLPVSEVSIGIFKDSVLAIDILATVILEETAKPSPEVFLERITLKRPYCLKCKRTLDETHADWIAYGVQTGYKCTNCDTERDGIMSDIYRDVEGEIRRNFETYWQIYSRLLHELTNGKPEDFRVE